jgi:hypothetical protein
MSSIEEEIAAEVQPRSGGEHKQWWRGCKRYVDIVPCVGDFARNSI